MRVLITGAAGFIGSHVAEQMLERGDTVTAVDNFNDYYAPAQKQANAARLERFGNCRMIRADIRDSLQMSELFAQARPEVVIHLAGYAGVRNSVAQPALYMQVNLQASIDLLELSRQHDVGNFVFASTSSVYGHNSTIPFVESDPCTLPPQPYAASKRAVEQIGYTWHQHYGLNFTAVRFFTVYGPRGRPDMMPALLADSIHTGRQIRLYQGEFLRDWTFVEDIADGVVAAADRPLGYALLNLGRGQPESLERFIGLMEQSAGGRANLLLTPPPATEIHATWADIGAARRRLDFQPRVDIAEGVERYCQWYQDYHGASQRTRVAVPLTLPLQPAAAITPTESSRRKAA